VDAPDRPAIEHLERVHVAALGPSDELDVGGVLRLGVHQHLLLIPPSTRYSVDVSQDETPDSGVGSTESSNGTVLGARALGVRRSFKGLSHGELK
jgi:hypothetical protein